MNTIPIKPMSVNEAWKGRRFRSDKYKKFERDAMMVLPRIQIPEGRLRIEFEFGMSNPRQDWDGPIKQFQDALQKKYGFDDNRIYEAEVRKVIVPKGQEYIGFSITGVGYE